MGLLVLFQHNLHPIRVPDPGAFHALGGSPPVQKSLYLILGLQNLFFSLTRLCCFDHPLSIERIMFLSMNTRMRLVYNCLAHRCRLIKILPPLSSRIRVSASILGSHGFTPVLNSRGLVARLVHHFDFADVDIKIVKVVIAAQDYSLV